MCSPLPSSCLESCLVQHPLHKDLIINPNGSLKCSDTDKVRSSHCMWPGVINVDSRWTSWRVISLHWLEASEAQKRHYFHPWASKLHFHMALQRDQTRATEAAIKGSQSEHQPNEEGDVEGAQWKWHNHFGFVMLSICDSFFKVRLKIGLLLWTWVSNTCIHVWCHFFGFCTLGAPITSMQNKVSVTEDMICSICCLSYKVSGSNHRTVSH